MKILFLTNEYPPHVYGGAGVHVDYLSRELLRIEDENLSLEILCFGDQDEFGENKRVLGVGGPSEPGFEALRYQKVLGPLYRNLVMAGSAEKADIVHCHTWYSHFAGCLVKQLMNVPMVVTSHSLEPLRPWKKEQLGDAYYLASWLEKTALSNADGIVAVSEAMKYDMVSIYNIDPNRIRVIYNGIDADFYRKTENPEVLRKYGVDPEKPYVLFVGRITRQKGIVHLARAIPRLKEGIQVVLCAGAPDTDEIADEMKHGVEEARRRSGADVVWIDKWVSKSEAVALYSHAEIFVCPSVYEPFGIINLEAMACETPVVASATGGIREVVEDGATGLLVHFEPGRDSEPEDPEKFSVDLADAINSLLDSPETIKKMGAASRRRVEELFSWKSIAGQTLQFYRKLIGAAGGRR